MISSPMAIIKKINFDPEFEPFFQASPLIEHELLTGAERAKEMLVRARRESSRLRKRAHEILEEAQREREEEKKKGFEEGREEGQASVTGEILKVAQAHEKVLREAEPEIIRMVMEIAEKVIGRELEKGAIVGIVQQAVRQATGQKIAVRLNPADVAEVKGRQGEILEALDQSQSIVVREDETIPAGGCIVESELGAVDARLETQLGAIRKALGL